jgi:hypothetical protein
MYKLAKIHMFLTSKHADLVTRWILGGAVGLVIGTIDHRLRSSIRWGITFLYIYMDLYIYIINI